MNGSSYNFHATASMVAALDTLKECAGGRFATIHGYVPLSTSKWRSLPKYDATILTRFDTEKLYARRLAALQAIRFEDCVSAILGDKVLANTEIITLRDAFNDRKAQEIASMKREREDTAAQRAGQNRCHVTICHGVRVHLKTEKNADGIMVPVLADDGLPIAESVRVHAIQQTRRYIVEGQRKPVNSGIPVRIGNAIKSALNFRSVGFQSFTLVDNFDKLSIDGNTIEPSP